jgi:hypothetical protein
VGAGAHQGGSDAAIERSLDVRAKIEAKSKTGVDKKSSAQALSESKAAELADAAAKKAAAAAAAAASKKGKK